MKARLRPTVFLVALSVIWAAFALAGPFLLATLSEHRPANDGDGVLGWYASIFHLRQAPTTLMAPWFAEGLLFAALGTLVVILIVRLLDPQAHSTRALRWSLWTIPCLLAWSCGVALLAALIVYLRLAGSTSGIVAGIVYGYFLALPFIFMRPDVIDRNRPPLLWRPGWPGLPAVVLSIVAFAAWYGVAVLVSVIPFPKALSWWLNLILGLFLWVLGLMLIAYVLRPWLHRWRWPQLASEFRFPGRVASTRVLAALDLQLLWLSVLLPLPFMLWIEATIDFATSHVQHAVRLHSTSPPLYSHTLVSTYNFVVGYWWIFCLLVYAVVYCWILLTTRARAFHLAQATETSAHV